MTTETGTVTIRHESLPSDRGWRVTWRAARGGVGAAGFVPSLGRAAALTLAQDKAARFGLRLIDEAEPAPHPPASG